MLIHPQAQNLQLPFPTSRARNHHEITPEIASEKLQHPTPSEPSSSLQTHHYEPPKIPELGTWIHQNPTFTEHPRSHHETSHSHRIPLQTLGSHFCPKSSNIQNSLHTQWNSLPLPPTRSSNNHLAARALVSAWNATHRRTHLGLRSRSSAEPDPTPGCRTYFWKLRHLPRTSGDAPEPPQHQQPPPRAVTTSLRPAENHLGGWPSPSRVRSDRTLPRILLFPL